MDFEVIICTYNRPVPVLKLIDQLGTCSLKPSRIIVVDASDDENQSLNQLPHVRYLRSSHKNQPYQRYVGYLASSAEILVFLDDDLALVNPDVFKEVRDCYAKQDVSGVSGGVDYESVITNAVGNEVDNATLKFKILNSISGVPKLQPGKIYPMGLAGPLLKTEGRVEYFHGPFMSFKKRALDSIFDPILFSLYEEKLGKGEDKVISMKVGLKETLWYVPTVYFKHSPVESHYFKDVRNFYKRLGFSRHYLSKVYVQCTGRNLIVYLFYYYYFMLWRLFIAAGKYCIKQSPGRLAVLQGYFEGVILTLRGFHLENNGVDWRTEALNDAKK